jgi:hypothetical protein
MLKGRALVTPQGILFRNKFYSGSFFIKEGWFTKALKRKWEVSVYYFKERDDKIFYIKENSNAIVVQANMLNVKPTLSESELQAYHRLLLIYKRDYLRNKRLYKSRRTFSLAIYGH